MQGDDKNLICFFSWGRLDLVKKSFESLLKNKREQDRLLVIDQEMLNHKYYSKHKKEIDFLFFLKLNYNIGPVWMLIKNFIQWKKDTNHLYCKKDGCMDKSAEKGWYPDYVNIIESDAVGRDGWIDRLVSFLKVNRSVNIISGYQPKNPTENSACGVQMMMRTEHFLRLLNIEILNTRSQDEHVCMLNNRIGGIVKIVPNEIIHIGEGRSKNPKSL